MTKIYKVESKNYVFYVKCQKSLEDVITLTTMYKGDPCSRFSFQTFENTAFLDVLGYNSNCAYNKNNSEKGLIRGKGTFEYFRAILTFIFTNNPKIEGCVFKDISTVNSKIDKNISISLRDVYLAAYNKTWYQYNFGAKPMVEEGYEDLINVNDIFNVIIEPDFESFIKKYYPNIENNEQFQLLKAAFKYDVVKPITLRDFVIVCKKKYDWLIFYKWVSKLVASAFKPRYIALLHWVIFPESIMGISASKRVEIKITNINEDQYAGDFDWNKLELSGTMGNYEYFWKKCSRNYFSVSDDE